MLVVSEICGGVPFMFIARVIGNGGRLHGSLLVAEPKFGRPIMGMGRWGSREESGALLASRIFGQTGERRSESRKELQKW